MAVRPVGSLESANDGAETTAHATMTTADTQLLENARPIHPPWYASTASDGKNSSVLRGFYEVCATGSSERVTDYCNGLEENSSRPFGDTSATPTSSSTRAAPSEPDTRELGGAACFSTVS